MNWEETLKNKLGEIILLDAPMKDYTTYKIGGAAQVLALPKNEEQIIFLKAFALEYNIPFRILGLGSNILVSEKGLLGITCCLKDFKGITVEGKELTAFSGTALDDAIENSIENALGGIECLSGIPGSCGGAVYMNAGAFNQETFDSLKCFKVLDAQGNIKVLSKTDVEYGYRKVKNIEDCIILSVTWALQEADKQQLKETRLSILKRRGEKQPLEYPSAGSVFKRPANDYASRLIDICGLRGLSVGGAKVSEKHAGFIVNYNKATAEDVYNLINEVRRKVYQQTSVELQAEQILWGEFEEAPKLSN